MKSIGTNEEIIVVAGAGRSGTTWLGNIVAGDEFKVLFEPFDYRKIHIIEGLGLRPYFRPHDDYLEWREIIWNIISGEYIHEWLINTNKELDLAKFRGVLIKDIRINGILKWLQINFNIKPVFIVRHPCAVAVSRIQCNWKPEVDSFLNNEELLTDIAIDREYLLGLSENKLYAHVIMWCFENAVPLSQFGNDLLSVKYEQLMAEPHNVVARILNELALTFDDTRHRMLEEISSTSTRNEINVNDLQHGWRNNISGNEIITIKQILTHFKLDELYEYESW